MPKKRSPDPTTNSGHYFKRNDLKYVALNRKFPIGSTTLVTIDKLHP